MVQSAQYEVCWYPQVRIVSDWVAPETEEPAEAAIPLQSLPVEDAQWVKTDPTTWLGVPSEQHCFCHGLVGTRKATMLHDTTTTPCCHHY